MAKTWRERISLSAFADEEQEEFLRARRRRGFSRPLIFVVVVVAAIFVLSLFFRVEDIRVEGNTHYTDEEIIRAIDIEEGDNLFFFDRFAAISRVFSKLPYIEEVTLKRALPNRITITVEESTAMAYLILGGLWASASCRALASRLSAFFAVSLMSYPPLATCCCAAPGWGLAGLPLAATGICSSLGMKSQASLGPS